MIDTVAKSTLGSVLGSANSLLGGLKALPGIAYPTLVQASDAETALLYDTLEKLPLHHVSQVGTIKVLDDVHRLFKKEYLGGLAYSFGFSSSVLVGRHAGQGLPDVTRHEIGHVVDRGEGDLFWFMGRSRHGHFGQGPHHTDYARTNRFEDFADSYKDTHGDSSHLREVAPQKHAAVEKLNHPTWLQSLVDRPEFRETGKTMGEMAQGSFAVRQGTEAMLAATTVLGIGYGLSQWMATPEQRQPGARAAGILAVASGAVMISGMAPLLGVGLQAANRALQNAIKEQRLTSEEVESTVSLPFRPLESALGVERLEIADEHRPVKVMAVGVGGAVGGVAGALAGPYLGVLAGYHLAGGLGGAIGFALGGLGGFSAGSYLGGRAADLLF
jgi:hypothetical protein